MIDAQLAEVGNAGPDALAIARGIMVAGAFIAEAIDGVPDRLAEVGFLAAIQSGDRKTK